MRRTGLDVGVEVEYCCEIESFDIDTYHFHLLK